MHSSRSRVHSIDAERSTRSLRLLGSLAAISAITLCFEVLLSRMMIFVAGRWYCNEVLGAAVMGVGIGAGWYGLRRGRAAFEGSDSRATQDIDGLVLWLVACCTIATLILRYLPWLPVEREQLWVPAALTAVLPFLVTGYATARVYSLLPGSCGLVYAADLLGACVGAVLALGLLHVTDVATSLLLAPAVGLIVLVAFLRHTPRGRTLRRTVGIGYAGMLAVGVLGGAVPVNTDFLTRSNTHLGQKLRDRAPKARLAASYLSAMSRVDLVTGDSADFMKLFINGGTLARVRRAPNPNTGLLHRRDEIPFVAQQGGDDWLVLGAGGGAEVALALASGAQRVVAVEFDSGVIEAAEEARDFSGDIYGNPRVDLVVEDARFFVARTPDAQFDRIASALTSSWANGSIGQARFDRTPVYTKEAALEYWRLLKPDGRMLFYLEAKWLAVRWILTIADALLEAGKVSSIEDLRHHLNMYTGTLRSTSGKALERSYIIVTKRAWSAAEWQVQDESVWREGWRRMEAGAQGLAIYRNQQPRSGTTGLDLSSVTDDRPFLQALAREPLTPSVVIAAMSFLGAVVLALVAFRSARRSGTDATPERARQARASLWAQFAYFFMIGAGFMGAEISLLRHTEYLVGHPMIALALTLGILLAAAGAGALMTQNRLGEKLPGLVVLAVSGIVAVLAALEAWVPAIRPIVAASDAPMALGMVVSAVLLGAAGLAMGVPFTAAVRLVGQEHDQSRILPWLYAINGMGGICGATLATLVHVVAGLRWVEGGTVALYLAAALLGFYRPRRTRRFSIA